MSTHLSAQKFSNAITVLMCLAGLTYAAWVFAAEWRQDQVTITGNEALVLEGSATVFDDITIDTSKARNGRGSPTWAAIDAGTVRAYQLDVGDGLFFSVQMTHRVKEQSTLEAHVHVGPDGTDGDGGNAEFTIECAWSNINDAFDTISALTSSDCAMGTGTDTHLICDVGDYTYAVHGVNEDLSMVGHCEVTRTAATADEYTGSVWLWAVDFHIELDKLGSRTEIAW